MDETIGMIVRGDVRPSDFYSHVVYFEDIDHALDLIRKKEALKVVLSFDR